MICTRDIRKYGEDPTQKHKVQTINYSKITIEYMENTESGYFWSNYVIRDDLPAVTVNMFTQLTQYIMANRGEEGWGGGVIYY